MDLEAFLAGKNGPFLKKSELVEAECYKKWGGALKEERHPLGISGGKGGNSPTES